MYFPLGVTVGMILDSENRGGIELMQYTHQNPELL